MCREASSGNFYTKSYRNCGASIGAYNQPQPSYPDGANTADIIGRTSSSLVLAYFDAISSCWPNGGHSLYMLAVVVVVSIDPIINNYGHAVVCADAQRARAKLSLRYLQLACLCYTHCGALVRVSVYKLVGHWWPHSVVAAHKSNGMELDQARLALSCLYS